MVLVFSDTRRVGAEQSDARRGAADPSDLPRRPEVELRPTRNQIDDLLNEIRKREEKASAHS